MSIKQLISLYDDKPYKKSDKLYGVLFDLLVPTLTDKVKIKLITGSPITQTPSYESQEIYDEADFWEHKKLEIYGSNLPFYDALKKIIDKEDTVYLANESYFIDKCAKTHKHIVIFNYLYPTFYLIKKISTMPSIRACNFTNSLAYTAMPALMFFRGTQNVYDSKRDAADIYLFDYEHFKKDLKGNECTDDVPYRKRLNRKPYKIIDVTKENPCMVFQMIAKSGTEKYNYIMYELAYFKYELKKYMGWTIFNIKVHMFKSLDGILAKGGIVMMNEMDIYFDFQRDFYALLTQCFDEVRFIKTSAKYLSLMIVTCIGFRGITPALASIFDEWVRKHDMCRFEYPEETYTKFIANDIKPQVAMMNRSNTLNMKFRSEFISNVIYFDKIVNFNQNAINEYKFFLYNRLLRNFAEMNLPIYEILGVDKRIRSIKFIESSKNLSISQTSSAKIIVSQDEISKIQHRLKWHLNFVLDQIDYIKWESFKKVTEAMRITNDIKDYVRHKQKIRVSQAYMKCLELMQGTGMVNRIRNEYRVFHICEAPGQFIMAFKHMAQRYGFKYVWRAQSLNYNNAHVKKNFPGALDDVYGLIKNNAQQWLWGKDNTGDITSIANIREYIRYAREEMGLYHLVTSDCGFSHDDFETQENAVLPLIISQYIVAVNSIMIGGSIFFKTFLPSVHRANLIMYQMLNNHFEELIYFKPILNPSSSEYYLIARNLKKPFSDAENKLLLDMHANKIVEYEINDVFLNNHMRNISELISNLSQGIIEILNIVHKIEYGTKIDYSELEKKRSKVVTKWIKKFM